MFNSTLILHYHFSSNLDTTLSCVQIETAILYILINFLRRLQKGILHILPSLSTENMDQGIDYFTQVHTPQVLWQPSLAFKFQSLAVSHPIYD